MNVPNGALWDYMIASTAWLAGFGSPSPPLVDGVAALLPAILGALSLIPVFWLTRRPFGLTAGLLAALCIAVTPGQSCGSPIWETPITTPPKGSFSF
jgi:dolichyl-diphosphooligosaccharide--protein glycosyltransferase